jgi:glycosyltransferase involved in cell wall biosynthesis
MTAGRDEASRAREAMSGALASMLRTSAESAPRTESGAPTAGYTRFLLILQSSAVGGMESHCIELAAELGRRGATVMAAMPEEAVLDPVANALRRSGAIVERVDSDARRGRLTQIAKIVQLARRARHFAPDVVHLHVGGATGGLAAVLFARLATNAVVVVTEHDVPSASPGLKQRLNRRLLDRAVHVLVAVSKHNANLRSQRLGAPAGKLAVVLNGAPLPSVSPATCAINRARIRSEFGLAADTTVIGSVVRLAPGKGLPTLLKAFAIVLKRMDARLLLVGGGPLEPDVHNMASDLGIQDKVVTAGHQPDPGLFVDAMDVFALAVPVGSGSIALLEAMARGKPAVITFGNGEEAVVHDKTGIWAPPEDPDALAAALFGLLADPDLRGRLGHAAARHVRQHYSIERFVDDLIDVYVAAHAGSIPDGLRATDPDNRQPGARRTDRLEARLVQ